MRVLVYLKIQDIICFSTYLQKMVFQEQLHIFVEYMHIAQVWECRVELLFNLVLFIYDSQFLMFFW